MTSLNVELPINKTVESSCIYHSESFSRKVYLYNDNFTPMEFVVDVLERVFKMDERTSERTTIKAHFDGKALCGEFPKDIAETMAYNAMDMARSKGHPLLFLTANK